MVELSIILPTYNERENLHHYLPKILNTLDSMDTRNKNFEVIIVDDNSPDRTWELADEWTKKDPRIRSFRRMGDKGLSSAVLFGVNIAHGEWILVMDADGQHDEGIIPKMLDLALLENKDLIVGSRLVDEGNYGGMSFIRRGISYIADRIGKSILDVPIKDSMSGYFLIRRDIVLSQIDSLNPKGFKILLEIVCRIPNLKFQEIPYKFRNRVYGKTKLSSKVAIDYILSLLEIRFKIKFSPYFIKYSIVGGMGIFVNLLFQYLFDSIIQSGFIDLNNRLFSISKNSFVQPGISVIFGFEMSLLHNFFWNHNWTFADRKEFWVTALIKFHFASIFSLIIQLSIWYYFYTFFLENHWYGSLATNVSNLIGILFAFISNYLLNKNLTWRSNS